MKNQKKARKSLSLQDKLEVIEQIERNLQETRAALAARLGYSSSTVKTIWRAKEEIKKSVADAGSSITKRSWSQAGKFSDVEKILFQWFQQQRAAKIPISGPLLQEKALEIARQLEMEEDFKASSGWLEKFKKRRGITGRTVCGEAGSVDEETVEYWKTTKLPDLIKGYHPRDIYNFDETGLFYNALPNKTLAEKGDTCTDGKRSKQRLTILLGTNADGSDKVRPLVIGKSKTPRCFRKVRSFPTDYENNSKAWMTNQLFKTRMEKFDARMRRECRNVLVFVVNCSAHGKKLQLTNVRLEFFPPNCTSLLQFLDLGIIANFKVNYREQYVRKVIASIDHQNDADSVKLNVLEAMHLVASAWESVEADTIVNCFRKGGVVPTQPGSEDDGDEDTLVEEDVDLGVVSEVPENWELIANGQDYGGFVSHDEQLAVCGMQSIEDLVKQKKEEESHEESSGEEEEMTLPAPSFSEALRGFEAASRFLCSKELSDQDMRVVNKFGRLMYQAHSSQLRQKTIDEFYE